MQSRCIVKPAGCVGRVVERNLDDTEAEILFEKKENLDEDKFLAICHRKIPLNARAERNPVREERISFRLEPVILTNDSMEFQRL